MLAFIKSFIYNNHCVRESKTKNFWKPEEINQGVQGSNPWRRTYESLMIWSLEPGCGAFIFCIENI